MTIHGAKGLEAPIVMLPDMLKPRTVNQLIGVDQHGARFTGSRQERHFIRNF